MSTFFPGVRPGLSLLPLLGLFGVSLFANWLVGIAAQRLKKKLSCARSRCRERTANCAR